MGQTRGSRVGARTSLTSLNVTSQNALEEALAVIARKRDKVRRLAISKNCRGVKTLAKPLMGAVGRDQRLVELDDFFCG